MIKLLSLLTLGHSQSDRKGVKRRRCREAKHCQGRLLQIPSLVAAVDCDLQKKVGGPAMG